MRKVLKWVGIAFLGLLVIFIGINAFDETLDPAAAAILNSPSIVRPKDNAYYYWVGMSTSAQNNPLEIGRRCVQAQQNLGASGDYNKPNEVAECAEQGGLKSSDNRLLACEWRKTPCLKYYLDRHALIEKLAAENQPWQQRYAHLLAFQQFEDSRPFPVSALITQGLQSNLYQAISALSLERGDDATFIHRTQAETRFYRMILKGETSLISKMIAAARLERSARLVSDVVAMFPQVAQKHQAALLEIVQPMSISERSLRKAFEAEFRYTTFLLRSIYARPPSSDTSLSLERLYYSLIYKRNATKNSYFQNVSVWSNLSELPPEQYLDAEKAGIEQLNPLRDGYVHLLYNPVGKILAGISATAHEGFPKRMIDTDGLLRLVSLQIKIAAMKIPEVDIPPFLARADKQLRDPYTAKPMQWDKSRGVYFQGHGNRAADKDGFISVKL